MRGGADNQVLSSTFLWMDHVICQVGSGFQNASGYYYTGHNLVNGLYTYQAPYKGIVADASVSGATIMTGVYLGPTLVGTGTSGLVDINYEENTLYFSSQITSPISGNFAVKEFLVRLTNKTEEEILFETKYLLKNEVTQTLSGLAENESTYPIIFLKNNGGTHRPFQFGGTDETITNVRAMILADSQWNLDAVTSLLKDQIRTYIPLFSLAEMPYNALGGTKIGGYNYNTLVAQKIPASAVFVEDVTYLSFDRTSILMKDFKKVNPRVFPSLMDLRLVGYRNPRSIT